MRLLSYASHVKSSVFKVKRKMFQMSTMILGVIRNNEELVSHNI